MKHPSHDSVVTAVTEHLYCQGLRLCALGDAEEHNVNLITLVGSLSGSR